jgi:glycerol-3-phosphate dehydrogenase
VLIGGFPELQRRRLGRLGRLGRLLRLRRRRSRVTLDRKPTTLAPDVARRLYRIYGANWEAIASLVTDEPSLGDPVILGIDVLRAEIVFAARHEMARTLLDVLARRTHVAMLDRDQARSAARDVAQLMARELGWDDAEIARQIETFQRDVGQYSVTEVTR